MHGLRSSFGFLLLAVAAHGQAPGELLLPATPLAKGLFGFGVDLDGDTLAISTANAGLNGPAGYVEVFTRTGGAWVLDATLLVPPGGVGSSPSSLVGYDLDLEGDDLIVGIPDHGPGQVGAVALYHRTAGVWGPAQVVLNPDTTSDRSFGSEVALEGDVALVGCPEDNGYTGAAYVLERSGGVWAVAATLRDPVGAFGNGFGYGLALDGGRAAITGRDILVFENLAGTWTPVERIVDPTGDGYFEVDLEGDLMAAGTWGGCPHSGAPCGPGWGTVLRFSGGAWVTGERLDSPFAPFTDAFFGAEIAVENGRILIGYQGETDLYGTYRQGGAVLFDDLGTGYTYAERIVPPTNQLCYGSGAVVALEGGRAVLGLPNYILGGQYTGAASVHTLGPRGRFVCDGTACPCGNDWPGQGCANSTTDPVTGRSGVVRASGTLSVAADDLVLWAAELPPSTFGLVVMGTLRTGPALAVGDGRLCLRTSQPLHRFPVRQADASGAFTEGPGMAAFAGSQLPPSGAIVAGSTWAFQAWYRDLFGPCVGGSSVTAGLELTFEP